jgi:hypothetical protein
MVNCAVGIQAFRSSYPPEKVALRRTAQKHGIQTPRGLFTVRLAGGSGKARLSTCDQLVVTGASGPGHLISSVPLTNLSSTVELPLGRL